LRYALALQKKWIAGDVATEGWEQIPAAPPQQERWIKKLFLDFLGEIVAAYYENEGLEVCLRENILILS
jgi:hypothetical protein